MKRFLTALAFSVLTIAPAPAVMAQEAAPQKSPAEQAADASALQTANALINYGRSQGDALAIVSAVQIIVDVTDGTTVEAAGGAPIDLGAVLDEAAELAGEDALLLAKVEELRDAAETRSRGYCYWEYWCNYYGYCEYWYVCF
ncbi:hypothetical protein [Pseudogemmobacter sonorensis]|uniref:hypothetical protein n=1 Tax=Pseudogemmobacter sonorensis TaxID=2989681 RepID=UPI0036A15C9E